MREIIGYHACRKNGGEAFVLANGPFLSKVQYKANSRNPSLGSGRYIWDENLPQAHKWGRIHYNDEYFVLKVTISYEEGDLLDLCQRSDIAQYQRIVEQLVKMGKAAEDEPVGMVIETARRLVTATGTNSFLWRLVRCEERKPGIQRLWQRFRTFKNPGFFEMDPLVIVCVFLTYPLSSLHREIVYPK